MDGRVDGELIKKVKSAKVGDIIECTKGCNLICVLNDSFSCSGCCFWKGFKCILCAYLSSVQSRAYYDVIRPCCRRRTREVVLFKRVDDIIGE